jgi:hypothetical protein
MKKQITMWFSLWVIPAIAADVHTGTDETAHLPFWELRATSLSLRLVQRLPDQTRAYFAGRGFNRQDSDFVAQYCIFQTVFTNTAAPDARHDISYDLRLWHIVFNGVELPLTLRENWREIWQQRNVAPPQKIAFEWSLLPTQQRYQATDYNWGMTVYKLPHGAKFDIKVVWELDGEQQSATIHNIECAKDIDIQPTGR